ncbi:MAG: hypothetical protein AAF317_06460 [Pseudomonadota bacterium]
MNLNGMLRIRPIYLLYWTAGSVLLGCLIAPLITASPEDHSTHRTHDHSQSHGTIEVDPANPPGLSIRVVKDALSGWNVFLSVRKFRFTPEQVNQANVVNEGHAHLYLNGEKLTRLYGTSYHLSNLPPGRNVVSVSLNANDHSGLLLAGQPIVAEAVIVLPAQ